MSWRDDLGHIRLLGPDEPEFDKTVKRVWSVIEKLEYELDKCKGKKRTYWDWIYPKGDR